MAAEQPLRMSIADYLAYDRASQDIRYEYDHGHVRALAGGSMAHALIAANLTALLHEALRAGPCMVFSSDMRLCVAESQYLYPDVVVSRDPLEHGDMLRSPRMIAEVLSASTEAYDRGHKFITYRACPALEDYLLIDAHVMRVEVFHRTGEHWLLTTAGPDESVAVRGLDVRLAGARPLRQSAL